MGTPEPPTQINTSAKSRLYRSRGWTWWLVPKPFDLVSSLLYLGVLVPYLFSFATQSGYDLSLAWWQAALFIASTIILLAVDRIEYFLYGDETPTRPAIFLLVSRIVFIEVLSSLDHLEYSPFLYLIVLFLACLYFVKHLYYSPDWLSNGTELHYLVLFTVGIVLVITIARVVTKEKAS